ncbi:hypothetical protein [Streptomyces buecherae]|uniref:hypothetical protein n=1 Tax=Streptomyces buecherae TaxID=2763006 RepID=UPI00378F8752
MTAKKPKSATAPKSAGQQIEAAEKKTTTFEHRGIVFTIPVGKALPIDVFETDDEIEATKLILGAKQWKEWKDSFEERASFGDWAELLTAITEAQGMAIQSGN